MGGTIITSGIGTYGFSNVTLNKIKQLTSESENEKAESLKQLRWGDNGIKFTYAVASGGYKGVDTQKDLDRVREYLN